LQSAELDRVVQKYAVVVAKNEFEPQFSLTGSLSRTISQSDNSTTGTTSYSITPEASIKTGIGTEFTFTSNNPVVDNQYNPALILKITQPLIRGFGQAVVEASLNNALDSEAINKLNLKNTVITTINQVITNYFAVVQAQKTLVTDRLSLKRYEDTVANDQAMITAGRMARGDIVQAQAQVETQKVSIENDINNIKQAHLTLLDSLGIDIYANVQLPKTIDFRSIASTLIGKKMLTLNEFNAFALKNNINYQTTGISLKQLARDVVVAKDNQRWKLDLTASQTAGGGTGGGKNSGLESLVNGRNHATEAELDLSIPIDDVAAKQQEIQTTIALQQANINYKELKKQLEINITNAYNTIQSTRQQVVLAERALALQQRTVEIARIKRNAGRLSTFELLNDQRDLTTADQTVTNSLITYINSLTVMNQILGTTLDRFGIWIKY